MLLLPLLRAMLLSHCQLFRIAAMPAAATPLMDAAFIDAASFAIDAYARRRRQRY